MTSSSCEQCLLASEVAYHRLVWPYWLKDSKSSIGTECRAPGAEDVADVGVIAVGAPVSHYAIPKIGDGEDHGLGVRRLRSALLDVIQLYTHFCTLILDTECDKVSLPP